MADQREEDGVPLTGAAAFDRDLYGGSGREGYSNVALDDEEPDQLDELERRAMAARSSRPEVIGEQQEDQGEEMVPGLGFQKPRTIYEREDDYRRRRLQRVISPERNDPFAMGDKTPDGRVRTYADIMREQQLQREMDNTMRNIAEKKRKEAEEAAAGGAPQQAAPAPAEGGERKRRRWDTQEPE